jgi:hypothetical protein
MKGTGKGKAISVLDQEPCHETYPALKQTRRHENVMGSGDIHILILGTRWR